STYGSLAPALTGLLAARPPTPGPVTESSPVDTGRMAVASAFGNVKLFTLDRERTSNRDVVMHLSTDSLTLLPNDGGRPVLALPYRQIQLATYVHARDPRWDPSLGSPPVKLAGSGLFSRARHWLVVQTKNSCAILQLDPERWSKIVQTFERRTGLTVARPTNGKN